MIKISMPREVAAELFNWLIYCDKHEHKIYLNIPPAALVGMDILRRAHVEEKSK